MTNLKAQENYYIRGNYRPLQELHISSVLWSVPLRDFVALLLFPFEQNQEAENQPAFTSTTEPFQTEDEDINVITFKDMRGCI